MGWLLILFSCATTYSLVNLNKYIVLKETSLQILRLHGIEFDVVVAGRASHEGSKICGEMGIICRSFFSQAPHFLPFSCVWPPLFPRFRSFHDQVILKQGLLA